MFKCGRSRRCNFAHEQRILQREQMHDEIKKKAEEGRQKAFERKYGRISEKMVYTKEDHIRRYFNDI